MLGICPATPLTRLRTLKQLLPTPTLPGILDISIGGTRLRTTSLTLTWTTTVITPFLITHRCLRMELRSLKSESESNCSESSKQQGLLTAGITVSTPTLQEADGDAGFLEAPKYGDPEINNRKPKRQSKTDRRSLAQNPKPSASEQKVQFTPNNKTLLPGTDSRADRYDKPSKHSSSRKACRKVSGLRAQIRATTLYDRRG
jgi:hypothetical protein